MNIAVISDIHGNLGALDAVLADIAARGVERIVNLGDIVSGGLKPRETADRLMPMALPTIRGNHERQVLTLDPERMGASDRFAAVSLRPDQREWMAGLPETLRFSPDILMVHGTPDSDLVYLLETVTPAGLREATVPEIEERIGDADAPVILCGHSHRPRVVTRRGSRLIVNPGSVGQPAYAADYPHRHVVENGTPHARYAVITEAGGAWSAELIAVAYDWEAAARTAEANGRDGLARALRTGRL